MNRAWSPRRMVGGQSLDTEMNTRCNSVYNNVCLGRHQHSSSLSDDVLQVTKHIMENGSPRRLLGWSLVAGVSRWKMSSHKTIVGTYTWLSPYLVTPCKTTQATSMCFWDSEYICHSLEQPLADKRSSPRISSALNCLKSLRNLFTVFTVFTLWVFTTAMFDLRVGSHSYLYRGYGSSAFRRQYQPSL